jgi:hypothetical protein
MLQVCEDAKLIDQVQRHRGSFGLSLSKLLCLRFSGRIDHARGVRRWAPKLRRPAEGNRPHTEQHDYSTRHIFSSRQLVSSSLSISSLSATSPINERRPNYIFLITSSASRHGSAGATFLGRSPPVLPEGLVQGRCCSATRGL